MARRELLALVVSGYIVAFLPVLWARGDVTRIPRSIWRYTVPRPRQLWRSALLVGYLCGGWPGLLVTFIWVFSTDRRALREEWAHLHRRNTESSPDPEDAAPPAEEDREIVLADFEDEPDDHRQEKAPPASGRPRGPAPG